MKKKPTLTMGIATYNEEANICFLLEQLIKQKQSSYKLEKIMILDDMSTDNTVRRIKPYTKKGVELHKGKTRKGKAYRINQLFYHANSDVVVVLDADILITDSMCIAKLIAPILSGRADLAAGDIMELPSTTFFEKMLSESMYFKRSIFKAIRSGRNVYTCHGRIRAFSKRFYKNLNIPHSSIEDSFSYFSCITRGYRYIFVKGADVYYKLPSSFMDHQRQSTRFYQSKKLLEEFFSQEILSREYKIPITIVFKKSMQQLATHPLLPTYSAVVLLMKIKSVAGARMATDTWVVAESSKNLLSL